MVRKKYWSYRYLLKVFSSKKTKKEKVFEHILYSICNFSKIEYETMVDIHNYTKSPFEAYVYYTIRDLKSSHLELPKYLDNPLDRKRYEDIKEFIRNIELKKEEVRKSGFNLFKRFKRKKELNNLLIEQVSINDVFNYFFLHLMEENNIVGEDSEKKFLIKLKQEFQIYAMNFPQNANFIML